MANGEMQPAHYGMKNGLSCVSTSNSYSALTEEGNLYVAGNTGVMKVNIDDPLEDVDNIKIAVPYVEADGKRIYPQKNDVFHISSKTQKLTVFPYVFVAYVEAGRSLYVCRKGQIMQVLKAEGF